MLNKKPLLCGVMLVAMLAASPAMADDDAIMKQLQAMQDQINALQGKVKTLTGELSKAKAQAADAKQSATTAEKTAVAAEAKTATSAGAKTAAAADEVPAGQSGGPVKITLGGFIEAAGIYRQHSQGSDVGSVFSTTPYPYLSTYHMPEFRESARQSRLSLLAQGKTEGGDDLTAYFESDFLGAAQTANSKESNSYNPRLRQAFAAYDDNNDGWHFLGGQAWSLITLDKQGIVARQENVPLTIDAQYVPGFSWTRNPQFRVVKTLDDNQISAGLSLESPQAIPVGTAPAGTTYNISGGSGYYSTTTYSTDKAPDIIGKLAFDPGFGHYEVYGLARFFSDRYAGNNNTTIGEGAGAAMILPLLPKQLDFQLSGLAGRGIGRYGTSQLPDFTFKPNGDIAPIGEFQALAGFVGHPDEKWDLYLYGGTERAQKQAYGTAYGYGNAAFNNSGCEIEGDPAADCVANTSAVSQLTAGAWWNFYKGKAGTMKFGIQDSYTQREIFSGVGGSPSTDENITMISFRYYPF